VCGNFTSLHSIIHNLLYNSGMSNPESSLDAGAPSAGIIIETEKRRRWFEVGLVLIVAFGSSVLYSLYSLKNGAQSDSPVTTLRWAALIVQEVSTLLLLGYVLSRRGLGFSSIGLRWSPMDVGAGMLLAIVSSVGYSFIRTFQHSMSGDSIARNVFGHPSVVMAIAFCLLNPFVEELVVRAYLMTEITELTGSTVWAVILSVVVQFSYHLYYGWAVAISLSFQFLVFALYYAYSRRALPVVLAHAFFDVYGMLRLLGS
jgi:membrane protease YdiL (CAAX protease family)